MGIQSMTFWSTLTIFASAVGGVLILLFTHIGEPKHAAAADERDVSDIQIRVERVVTEVARNKEILDEVKIDVREIRVEQRAYTETILRAIREMN